MRAAAALAAIADVSVFRMFVVGIPATATTARGPLRISAVEQVCFLTRLSAKELPVSAEAQAAVRDILLFEQTPDWSLFAKTGSAVSVLPPVGWWVGWVEKSGRVYVFALNMDIGSDSLTAARIEFGKTCLQALKVLPR